MEDWSGTSRGIQLLKFAATLNYMISKSAQLQMS